MRKGFWLILIAGAALLIGCEEDRSAECDLAAKGDFVFFVVPGLPSGSDSTADIDLTVASAVVDTIIVAPNFTIPTITYRFRAVPSGWFGTRDIRLNDVLLSQEPDPAKRGFPVVQGQTYTLHFELSQQIYPPAMSIRISDAQGIRFFGVDDWRPSGTTGAQIYENGYGDFNPGGELSVAWADGGCQTQSVDFSCYQEWTNRRLDFLIGNDGPLGLWSGQQGTLGSWHFIVYKAVKVVSKAGCFEGLLKQNGVSFTVERTGLR
jgi:hypothetical protein